MKAFGLGEEGQTLSLEDQTSASIQSTQYQLKPLSLSTATWVGSFAEHSDLCWAAPGALETRWLSTQGLKQIAPPFPSA